MRTGHAAPTTSRYTSQATVIDSGSGYYRVIVVVTDTQTGTCFVHPPVMTTSVEALNPKTKELFLP